MNRSHRTVSTASAAITARIAFACTMIGACAVGLTPLAYADPCDPQAMSMTPRQSLTCSQPEVAVAPPVGAPPPIADSAALPAPGQPPGVPPVLNEDGTPGVFGEGAPVGDLIGQLRDGLPNEMFGPELPAGGVPGQRLPGQPPPPPGASPAPEPPPLDEQAVLVP